MLILFPSRVAEQCQSDIKALHGFVMHTLVVTVNSVKVHVKTLLSEAET